MGGNFGEGIGGSRGRSLSTTHDVTLIAHMMIIKINLALGVTAGSVSKNALRVIEVGRTPQIGRVIKRSISCYPTSIATRPGTRAGGIAIQGGIHDERPRHRHHRTVHARLIPRVDASILGARPSPPRFTHLERPSSSSTSTTHSHRVGAGRGGGRIRGVHGIFFHRSRRIGGRQG